MRSVLVTVKNYDRRFPQAMQYLREHNVEVIIRDSIATMNAQEKAALLGKTPALLVAAEPCDAALLRQAGNLKILSRMGSGMDNIDLGYCREHDIAVSNSKGCNANAVAEMALLLILSSLRGLHRLYHYAREGVWEKRFPGEELYGKTVGLVGFGMIAQRLAALLAAFSVKILACDPYMDEKAAASFDVTPVAFDMLLEKSDIVSLHIPALKENVGLFREDTFAKMKDGAVFINCSRGALVKEDDLYHALAGGKLRAAASDVWGTEPVAPYHRLFNLENFIGTPHAAGMTTKSAVDDSMAVAASIVACLDGREIPHRVV